MSTLVVRPFEPSDLAWAEALIGADFGGRLQARMGTILDALACPGFVAEANGRPSGIVTFAEDDEGLEVVYLQATEPRRGVGTNLLEAVVRRANGRRVWLVTTNDNLDALRFYQRRGFRLVQLRVGAVDDARRDLKPAIPALGNFQIPVRDELILELERAGTA
jgi:ribosomal protein S18 acetylase RimI-like enzyme